MKPSEYFDAAKDRLNIESDYALCKKFGITDKGLPAMRNGSRRVPLDIAYKLAITLEIDPALVVADLEGDREKNPQRKAFWSGFLQRAVMLAVTVACTLVLNFSATCANGLSIHGGNSRRPCRA